LFILRLNDRLKGFWVASFQGFIVEIGGEERTRVNGTLGTDGDAGFWREKSIFCYKISQIFGLGSRLAIVDGGGPIFGTDGSMDSTELDLHP